MPSDDLSEKISPAVWAKSNGGMGSFYRSAHELVFLFKSGTGSHRNNIQLGKFGRYRTNVWNYPGANTFSRSDSEGNLLALRAPEVTSRNDRSRSIEQILGIAGPEIEQAQVRSLTAAENRLTAFDE